MYLRTANPQNLIIIVLLFLLFTTLSCTKKADHDFLSQNEDTFIVWALADTHISDESEMEKKAFIQAVDDVNRNVAGVDIAIVAGDIADKPSGDVYRTYNSIKGKSYIENWFEVIGNHDLKDDEGASFRKYIREKTDYSVIYGNMLFIFMSDSVPGKPTEISDATFSWWKNLVKNNQDKIIVVMTHAPLEGSSLPFSSRRDRQIIDSHRFMKVMEKYRVDIWLSAHLHLPHAFNNTIVRGSSRNSSVAGRFDFSHTQEQLPEDEELNETIFVHISAIRPDLFWFIKSESRFLTFYCGTNILRISSRNHTDEIWHNHLNEYFRLSNEINCRNV